MNAWHKSRRQVESSAIAHLTVSLLIVGLNFLSPPAYIALGGAYVIYLVFRCKVHLLPAIIALFFSRADFTHASLLDIDQKYATAQAETMWIGPFPVSISYYLYLSVLAYLIYTLFVPGKWRQLRTLHTLFLVYLASAIFPIVSTIYGKQAGSPYWTVVFRLYASMSVVFYGALIYESWEEGKTIFLKFLFFLFLCMLTANAARIYSNHFVFTAVCSVFGCCYYAVASGKLALKCLGIAGFGFAVAAGMGAFGEDAFQSTITLIGLTVVGVCLVLQKAFGPRAVTGLVTFLGRHSMYVACAAIIVLAINRAGRAEMASYDPSAGYGERARYKLLNDRGLIWRYAWQDAVRDGNYWFDKAGAPIEGEASVGIEYGAHNGYVEMLRTQRFVTGPILIMIVIVVALAAPVVYRSSKDKGCVALSMVVMNTMVFGMMTGAAPVCGKYWPFVFLVSAGICYVHRQAMMQRWRPGEGGMVP